MASNYSSYATSPYYGPLPARSSHIYGNSFRSVSMGNLYQAPPPPSMMAPAVPVSTNSSTKHASVRSMSFNDLLQPANGPGTSDVPVPNRYHRSRRASTPASVATTPSVGTPSLWSVDMESMSTQTSASSATSWVDDSATIMAKKPVQVVSPIERPVSPPIPASPAPAPAELTVISPVSSAATTQSIPTTPSTITARRRSSATTSVEDLGIRRTRDSSRESLSSISQRDSRSQSRDFSETQSIRSQSQSRSRSRSRPRETSNNGKSNRGTENGIDEDDRESPESEAKMVSLPTLVLPSDKRRSVATTTPVSIGSTTASAPADITRRLVGSRSFNHLPRNLSRDFGPHIPDSLSPTNRAPSPIEVEVWSPKLSAPPSPPPVSAPTPPPGGFTGVTAPNQAPGPLQAPPQVQLQTPPRAPSQIQPQVQPQVQPQAQPKAQPQAPKLKRQQTMPTPPHYLSSGPDGSVDRRIVSEPVPGHGLRKSRSISSLGSKIKSMFSSSSRNNNQSTKRNKDTSDAQSVRSMASTFSLSSKILRRKSSNMSMRSFSTPVEYPPRQTKSPSPDESRSSPPPPPPATGSVRTSNRAPSPIKARSPTPDYSAPSHLPSPISVRPTRTHFHQRRTSSGSIIESPSPGSNSPNFDLPIRSQSQPEEDTASLEDSVEELTVGDIFPRNLDNRDIAQILTSVERSASLDRKGSRRGRTSSDADSKVPNEHLVSPSDMSISVHAPHHGDEATRESEAKAPSIVSTNTELRGPLRRSIPSRYSILPKSPRKGSVTFASQIVVFDTYSCSDYDRRPEPATCNRLTPLLAQQIKQELNTLKLTMPVHEASRVYTHFF